mmetsp:Transcript_2901/g.18154  ORF Transcript_2901/g.18154 Transcript_2901/m.18154 type:complete len:431 (+) Transcript_2901:1631-2923(+)
MLPRFVSFLLPTLHAHGGPIHVPGRPRCTSPCEVVHGMCPFSSYPRSSPRWQKVGSSFDHFVAVGDVASTAFHHRTRQRTRKILAWMATMWKGTVHALRRGLNRTMSTRASSKVSLDAIRALRATSGAPMAEVKAALQSSDGDMERAMEELRKRGVAASRKKADRNAAEGAVAVHVDAGRRHAALVEINTETDFAARTDTMQDLARKAARAAAASAAGSLDVANTSTWARAGDIRALQDAFAEAKASLRENLQWRRAHKLQANPPRSTIGSYVHNEIGRDVGSKAALVVLEASDDVHVSKDVEEMASWADRVAMHVVAMRPRHVDVAHVPDVEVHQEESILAAQLQDASKPPAVVEKIVQGRMRKFYEEHCLLQQRYVLDDRFTVQEALSTAMGVDRPGLAVVSFVRYDAGEGLPRTSLPHAHEVASTSG